MSDGTKTALLIKVAELYYERQLSQRNIADLLELSRPMVSRLLSEARETGIVTIHIHRPTEQREDLAGALRKRFGLKEAVVVSAGDTEAARKNVGTATADLLSSILQDGSIVGVSWGRDLYHAITAVPGLSRKDVQVVQLAGGLGEGDPASDGPELVRRLGENLGAKVRYLHAPTVVQTKETRDLLVGQAQLAQTLKLANKLDIALTGIGALDDVGSSLSRAGYLSSKDRKTYQALGGVAHLLGYLLDAEGALLDHDYNRRVVAAPLAYLKKAKWSIGVATAPSKAAAILATLRGGYFNTVVFSDAVAKAVLETVASSADVVQR